MTRRRISRLGVDVEAARRLVEQQELWGADEPAREHDFLLIAARKRRDLLVLRADLDAKALDHRRRGAALLRGAHKAQPRNDVEVGHDDVVSDRHPEEQPFAPPVLGDKACAPIELRWTNRGRSALFAPGQRPAIDRVEPDECAQKLRSPGAEQAPKANHFAGAQGDRQVLERVAAAQSFDAQ